VRHIRGHLLKIAHNKLARDAKDCCGYSKREHANPATLSHGKGHGEQAYAHEYIDLSRERHESTRHIYAQATREALYQEERCLVPEHGGQPKRMNSVRREQHERQSLGLCLRYLKVTQALPCIEYVAHKSYQNVYHIEGCLEERRSLLWMRSPARICEVFFNNESGTILFPGITKRVESAYKGVEHEHIGFEGLNEYVHPSSGTETSPFMPAIS